MAKVGSWSTTAGSNNSTPPDGWPEGQAPSTVNDCAREMMAALRTVFNDSQFVDQNLTPTYVSATQFSVTGNQTSAIHAGRRLKIFDATAGVATVLYATVTTASFTAVTNIHVTADAGQLTSSLSSFAMSILSSSNNSIPQTLSSKTLVAPVITDYRETVFSVSVAALGTLNIDWVNGTNYVVTTNGTTTINLPAPVAGKSGTVDVIYGGTHSLIVAVASGTLRWPDNVVPIFTSTAGKRDKLAFHVTDTTNTCAVVVGLNFAG